MDSLAIHLHCPSFTDRLYPPLMIRGSKCIETKIGILGNQSNFWTSLTSSVPCQEVIDTVSLACIQGPVYNIILEVSLYT